MAYRMAVKTYEKDLLDNLEKPRVNQTLQHVQARIAAQKAKQARPLQITIATMHYAGDLTKTTLRGKYLGLILGLTVY